jgi:hypothetical protein
MFSLLSDQADRHSSATELQPATVPVKRDVANPEVTIPSIVPPVQIMDEVFCRADGAVNEANTVVSGQEVKKVSN